MEKDKTPKAPARTESKFAERMQDFSGITIIKANEDVSQDFVDRITDSSGIEVTKKEPKNKRVD
jgi:hypothetical protein